MSTETQAKRARGEGHLYLRGCIWWMAYYDHGRKVRESCDTENEKKALKMLRDRLAEVRMGLYRDTRNLGYEDIRDAYLAQYSLDEKKSLRRTSDGKPYLESVRRLDDFFRGFRAVEIDPGVIRKFQQEKRKTGLANGSINRAVSSLCRMFTLAQHDGKIRNLPFFPMLPEAKPRKGTLKHEQYAELLAALPDYLRPAVIVGFRTGMRLGEILGLTWQNVDWIEKIIRIDDSKNGEPREIPFSGELETALARAVCETARRMRPSLLPGESTRARRGHWKLPQGVASRLCENRGRSHGACEGHRGPVSA